MFPLGCLLLNAGHFNTAQLAADLQQKVLSIHEDSAGHPVTLSLISVKRRIDYKEERQGWDAGAPVR